jgi:PAS domain S-box-containing protein
VRRAELSKKLVSGSMPVQQYVSRFIELMNDPAGYSPLGRLAGIQMPRQLVDKNAYRRLALLIGKGAFIALLYYLLIVIGMKLHFSTSGLSLIWPSNALLAATLVLSPKSRWWFYLLAIIPAHIAAMSSYNLGLWWLAFQIAFNSALTVTYAAILQRFKPEILYFEALRDVLIFLGVSVAVPVVMNWVAIYPVFKFSPSSSALLAHNSSVGFFAVWTSCWINNSASFIAFVPVILVCATRGRSWFRGFSSRRVAEGALLTMLFITAAFLAYGRVATNDQMLEAIYLVPIPFLLWAAVRFGPAGASLSVAGLVCISSWCAYAGEGPFLRSSFIDRVTSMQISWIMICAPVLALAAVVRERKFVTLAFLKSEGRFRQFFETQPECCYMISPDGIVLDVNPAACEALGYTKEELIGKAVSIIYAPESHSKMRDLLEKWKKTGRLESEEIIVLTRDGERRVVLVNAGSVVDAEENLLHSTTVHVDITERKRAEEALSTVNQRLIEAQEEERRRIARELHDDINQRIALLAVKLESLQLTLPTSVAEIRQAIGEASNETKSLGNDIQALSHRLHSSKLEYFGLASAARGFCRELSDRQGMEIGLHSESIPKDLPREISLCLFRVLQEALQNAIKHSGSRHFQVSLSGGSSEVELTVRDSGTGFDPEDATRGSGLGLTSIRERLKLVNGTLSIDSQSHRGTTIRASVPLSPKTKSAAAS